MNAGAGASASFGGLSPVLVIAAAVVLGVACLAYWLLVLTEGAYLGPRSVRWLYDLGASTYDGVKRFDRVEDITLVAAPLFSRLDEGPGPRARVLDAATGTARLPLALFDIPFFEGIVVGLDISRPMLRQAEAKTAPWAPRFPLLRASAVPLPFGDGSFDAVTLLEASRTAPAPWPSCSASSRQADGSL
jgi:hypothetical protein